MKWYVSLRNCQMFGDTRKKITKKSAISKQTTIKKFAVQFPESFASRRSKIQRESAMMYREILSPIHEGLVVSSGLDASNVWRCSGHGLYVQLPKTLSSIELDRWWTCFECYLLQCMTTKTVSLKAITVNYRCNHTPHHDKIHGDLDRL